jgi:hypothetical protein
MPKIEITITGFADIEIYCAMCGTGICNLATATETRSRRQPSFRVKACDTCMEKEYARGKEDGYAEGYEEGKDAAS